jgi:cell division protein FtsW
MLAKKVHKEFFLIGAILIAFGIVVFLSAALGLLGQGETPSWIIAKQFISLALGLIFFAIGVNVKYTAWKKYAFTIFILSYIATLLVFIPGVGLTSGGATRWLNLGPLSFQPAEFLKFGFVVYFAAILSNIKDGVRSIKYGLLPMLVILGIIGGALLLQPSTGILVVISFAAFGMFFISGAKWKHIGILILLAIAGLLILVSARPYVKDRFITFLNPSAANPQAEGYQSTQALIGIGSGGMFGRGFGQSIQKFNYLPEPVGDSIFAVLAEEFGFIGGSITVLLFLLLSIFGLKIAVRAPDSFGRLVASGIVILITAQSFLNIGAMLGVFPLSGIPVLFISQGGSALMFALLEMGIILNISKYER